MAVYTHTTESESIFQIQTPTFVVESGSFSYNFSSAHIVIVYDFGSILDTVIEEEDYQNNSLNEAVDSYEDYGYVSGEPTKIYGLFNFTGTPIVGFNLTAFVGITFALQGGSLAAFGQPYIGYGSFKCNGSANEAFVPKTEIGSGTLYNFVSKEERATFSYNQSSIAINTFDDYGFIIDSYQDIDDFGIITKLVNRPDSEDYGNISTNDLRPYGNITFSGNASRSVNFILTANPEGGSLFSFTGSGEAFVPQISPKEGVFKIFGGLDRESFIPYIPPGSGSISKFVTKEERRTFSYNGSQQTNSFKIFGDNSKTSRIRLVYIGSGSLFTFGGGNESITPFIPERFTLFNVSGAATERITPATHIGSGTLFNFITKEERRTFSYNGSSVVIRNDDDYGFIRDIAVTPSPSISSYANTPISTLANEIVSTFGVVGNQDDYGSIGEVVNRPDSEDYGFITSTQERRPFGRLIFSGGLIEQFTPKYFGSGTLFAFNNALVSKSPIHVGSGSFNITGSATLSALTSEIGSGVLFTFVSADESKTFRHISDDSTGLRISGEVSDLASTVDEVGTGRLFAATGAAESFGANPFIPPALFKFKSGSTESFTPATHVVTGVVSPRRASAIFDPEEKIRLVGATESTTNSPDIPASGFSIKAPPVRIFFQYREQGGGKLKLAGNARIRLNPRHTGTGEFTINGIGNEAIVPFIPPGSGSLFSFVNGDESTTPATHIGQGKLFSLRGTAETQFPRGFVGGGQIRVNVETGIIVIWDYPVNLTIPVRGDTDYAVARDYIGTGKFTISDESDNYFANRFFSLSGGFSILGKAAVRVPRVYSGSGTLFAFDSSAENTGANPPDRTLPIRLVGTANESKTEIFNGSGFITSKEKRAEGLLEEYALASANESFVSVPPTKDSAITIEGSRENETQSSDYVGSGSLFSFDSATESTLYSPIGEITLFEFEGNLEESRAFSYSEKTQRLFGKDTNLPKPFGKQFVFGTASVVSVSSETGKDKAFRFDGGITSETFTPAEESKGSLFGLNSSTESVLYSPIGEITLFEFEGNSDEKISLVTIGSGSLFGFVNGAESSLVEPPTETLLLNITGSATERIAPGPHSGSGTIFSFIGSAESTTSAEDKKVLFKINVDSSEKRTSTFEGLGKITSLGSSTKVIVFKYPPTEGILQIFGNKIESFGKANYDGECRTQFIGISSNKTVEFEPPKPIRLYLI